MNKLELKKVKGYRIRVSTSEKSSGFIGLYKDYNIAKKDSIGAGWYGSNGEVENMEIYQDANGELYQVEHLGQFTDEKRKYEEEMVDDIKKKLTPEELKYLGLKK